MCARSGEILRPQAHVEADGSIQATEVGVLGLVEAGHEGVSLGPGGLPPHRNARRPHTAQAGRFAPQRPARSDA